MGATYYMTSDPELFDRRRGTAPGMRPEQAQLIRQNRILLRLVFTAVAMIGPLFTGGYVVGRLTAPKVVQETAPAAEQQIQPAVATPASRKAARARTAKDSVPPPPPLAARPADGQVYLQLFATADYQVVLERLRRDGFAAVATEVPEQPELRRILVGPVPASEVGKTRAALESKGFPGKAAITRTF